MTGKSFRLESGARSKTGWRGRRVLYGLLYAGFAVWFLASFLSQYDPEYGYTHLIRFGKFFQERSLSRLKELDPFVLKRSDGYDGQFYAQLALAPDLTDPELNTALDNPVYRARRILFSVTAYLLGLGQPALVLQAYALQNLLAWALLAWLMTRWFPPGDFGNLLRWLGCLFCFGLFRSCDRALVDGPSMLLIAFAVLLVEQQRQNLATVLLAVTALGKETNLFAAALLFEPGETWRRTLAPAIARSLLVVLPLLLWFGYVVHSLEGNVSLSGNFGIPLRGYWIKLTGVFHDLTSGKYRPGELFNLLHLIGFCVQAAFLALYRRPASAWWRLGAAYAVLAVFLSPKVLGAYPGAYLRVLLPITFAFNVLLPRDPRRFVPLWILGNLGLIATFDKLTSWLP